MERGYVRCEIDRRKWRADYRTVESVMRRGAPIVTRRSFVVEAGQRTLIDA
jgi:alkaline phosphatase D